MEDKEKEMKKKINSKKGSINPSATSSQLIENYDFDIKNYANDKITDFNSKMLSYSLQSSKVNDPNVSDQTKI